MNGSIQASARRPVNCSGRVLLVGAGPGDPDLLTLRALDCIRHAEVVVFDRLVSQGVLDQVPTGVPRFYVGKSAGNHTVCQADINRQLVSLARSGNTVVRLKGGDPFMFGRGGEEALHLRAHGVPFEIVPGVTSASACASYCGIPLTHRTMAQGVQFVTGHCRSDQPLQIDWNAMADPSITVVFYMGLATVAQLRAGLLAAGRAPQTAAAIIERGTLPDERSWVTTLDGLERVVAEQAVKPPALIIVGDVASLADQLQWRTNELAADAPVASASGRG